MDAMDGFCISIIELESEACRHHPDGHGGLGFLGLVPIAFTPISFAAATAVGADMAARHPCTRRKANELQVGCDRAVDSRGHNRARTFGFFWLLN
jgi:hypothetical protein